MIDFNLKEYVRSALPDGRYTFRIKNAELKYSKSGDQMANIQLEVVSEFRRGQTIFKNLNIYNPSEAAQRMAREELADICTYVGIDNLKDLKELHNKIVDADVIAKEYMGKPSNEVKRFYETVGIKTDFQAPEQPIVEDKFNDEVPF
jgi:hypothetical protein